MRRFAAVVGSIAFLVLLLSTPAFAADAARGSTLYHATYACTDCHAASPGKAGFLTATSGDEILSAILSVDLRRPLYANSLA